MDNASDHAMHQYRHDGGEYRRIELITGVTRRRRWTEAEKATIVAESMRPGINVSAVARRFGVARGLLQTWRRNAIQETASGGGVFVPLHVCEEPAIPDASHVRDEVAEAERPSSRSVMEMSTIEIESGPLRVRFSGPVDAGALRTVLAHVGGRA
jgi:transposase